MAFKESECNAEISRLLFLFCFNLQALLRGRGVAFSKNENCPYLIISIYLIGYHRLIIRKKKRRKNNHCAATSPTSSLGLRNEENENFQHEKDVSPMASSPTDEGKRCPHVYSDDKVF